MLILLALIFAAVIGIALEFLLPGRATRGVALAPLVAAATAGLVYTVCTWMGLAEDNPWLWVASLGISTVLTLALVLTLTRVRVSHDDRERVRLRIA